MPVCGSALVMRKRPLGPRRASGEAGITGRPRRRSRPPEAGITGTRGGEKVPAFQPINGFGPKQRPRKDYPPRGSIRDGLGGTAIDVVGKKDPGPGKDTESYTSSFLAPISVRKRSASNAASNGFLKVSLMLERSKLVELPSSGKSAIRITSANSLLRRRF